MLHIALVDDKERELQRIEALIENYQGVPLHLLSFSSPGELCATMKNGRSFDLYLLDVVMPEMDGIELGRFIRARDEDGAIVYLTTSPDFALESYEVWSLQYLLKPVDPARLYDAIDRAVSLQKRKEKGIFVHAGDGDIFLPFDEILYAEKYGRRIRYVCSERIVEGVSLRGSFSKAAEPLLNNVDFLLCNASLAVNLSLIDMVDKEGVLFFSGARLNLPKAPCKAIRTAWLRHYLKGGAILEAT